MINWAGLVAVVMALGGCGVVSAGASAVGAAVDVAGSAAGAAVDVTGAAASGAVGLAMSPGEESGDEAGKENSEQ